MISSHTDTVASIESSFRGIEPGGTILPLGSVAHGWADKHSDVDILVIWTERPGEPVIAGWIRSLADSLPKTSESDVPNPPVPTWREDRLVCRDSPIHLFHAIRSEFEAFVHGFKGAEFPAQTLVNEWMMPFSRMHFSGQRRIQAEQVFSAINALDPTRSGNFRSECGGDYADQEIRALWIDIDSACRDLRKYAIRGSVALVARASIQIIRDVLWLFALNEGFHFPGIDHSAKWLPGSSRFRSAHSLIEGILIAEGVSERVEMLLDLVQDLDVLIRRERDLSDVPRIAKFVKQTDAISVGLFEPTGEYWPIVQPHRLPELYDEITARFLEVYKRQDSILAFGRFGSVPRGVADGWSDLDFFALAPEYASPDERKRIVAALCSEGDRGHSYYHDSDCFWIDGIGIHVDCCVPKDNTWEGTLFHHNEQLNAEVLYDPQGIMKEVRRKFLSDQRRRTNRGILRTIAAMTTDRLQRARRSAEREDVIAFDYHISELVIDTVTVISYLNDGEKPHLKWMERLLQGYALKPENAIQRLHDILLGCDARSCTSRMEAWERLNSEVVTIAGDSRDITVELDAASIGIRL